MSVYFSKLSILSAAYILIISPSCSERKKQPLDQKPEAHPTIPETKPLAEKDEMVDLYKKASWSAINQDLHGTLITGKKTKPISLFYRKEGLQCLAGEQRIHLKFDHTLKGAYVVHDSNTKPTDKSRISAPLCHSAVTIEDFFLYHVVKQIRQMTE